MLARLEGRMRFVAVHRDGDAFNHRCAGHQRDRDLIGRQIPGTTCDNLGLSSIIDINKEGITTLISAGGVSC